MSEYRGEKPGEPKDAWKQDGEARRREIGMEGPDVPEMSRRMDIRLSPEQQEAMRAHNAAEAQQQAEDLRDALRARVPHTPGEGAAMSIDRHQGLEVLLQRIGGGLAVDGSKRSLWEKAGDWWSGKRQKTEVNIVRDVRDAVRSYGEHQPDAAQDVDGIQSVEQARAAMAAIRRHKESRRK